MKMHLLNFSDTFQSDDLDEILPNLYLGSWFAAESIVSLEERKITHILNLLNPYKINRDYLYLRNII